MATTDFNVIRNQPDELFHVKIEAGKLRVLNHQAFLKEDNRREVNVRRKGIPIVETEYRDWIIPHSGARVKGGFLHAIDNGEWGGGIYFEPNGSKKLKRISFTNTQMVEAFPQGIYAIQSVGHMDTSFSHLVELTRTKAGWHERRITDLHDVPGAWARIKEAFVLATDKYVTLVYPTGLQREIFRASFFDLGARSSVILPNGEIWFGCGWGLLCLKQQRNKSYESSMFVRAKKAQKSK